jgi:Mrp family chromosome partitioning ATPase
MGSPTPVATDDVTLLGSIRRYWWLVLGIALVFIVLGFLLSASKDEAYEATASVIVEDARAQNQFSITEGGAPSNQASERYLADQVEIMSSAAVAEIASEQLTWEPSAAGIVDATTVEGDLTSNRIDVRFVADTAEHSKEGADAVIDAYVEVKRERARESADAAAASIDGLIAVIDERLESLNSEIADLSAGSIEQEELNRQLEEARSELNDVRLARDQAEPGGELRAVLNARIDELLRDFAAWDAILRVEQPDPQLAALAAERDAAVADRSALVAQKDRFAADADAAGAGVVLVSPAEPPEDPLGFPLQVVVVVAAVLGLALGAALAYGLVLRHTNVSDRREPERLLGAPLVVEIPAPGHRRDAGQLPLLTTPNSKVAESYRFIASAIGAQQRRVTISGGDPARVLAIASASHSEGRAAATTNVAIAFAQEGHRVLVIDADLEHQLTSSSLLAGSSPSVGLAEIVGQDLDPKDAIVRIEQIGGSDVEAVGGTLDLLGRGGDEPAPNMLVRQSRFSDLVAGLGEQYDLVMIDCPPLLSVSYASPVVDLADAVLAVVGHGQEVTGVVDFGHRLEMVGVPIVGYVYDRSDAGVGFAGRLVGSRR